MSDETDKTQDVSNPCTHKDNNSQDTEKTRDLKKIEKPINDQTQYE